MSHFSVLVIGDDIEQQLAPYHEFECTGCNDEFVQDIDITAKVQEQINEHGIDEGVEYFGLHKSEDESEIDFEGPCVYGYAIVKDGKLVKAIDRTNPNNKWDWWMIGGRWSGFFKATQDADQMDKSSPDAPKKGNASWAGEHDAAGVDQAMKSQIDFEAMRSIAGRRAEETYDQATKVKVDAGFAADAQWDSWQTVVERNNENYEQARAEYNAQEVLIALSKGMDNPFFDIDELLVTRDEYIQRARNAACVPYAVVTDDQWISKGEMGWFGMSDDDVSQEEWNAKVNELLDSLPGDTLLTIVDCRI